MLYSPDIVSTVLFESNNVNVFKIPPGDVNLSKWNLKRDNVIWTGNIRLIEQELINDHTDVWDISTPFGETNEIDPQNIPQPTLIKPYNGLRAKLELYNKEVIPPTVGSLTTITKDVTWGEVWYNPIAADAEFLISNDGLETLQMTRESPKYYKFIVQLPGSGYHPFVDREKSEESSSLLQVALGIKFNDSFQAISFSDSLNTYRRRFRNFQEQYQYDLKVQDLEKALKEMSLSSPEDEDTLFPIDQPNSRYVLKETLKISPKEIPEEDDNDDFDDFVTA
jgi:hypothetical protein